MNSRMQASVLPGWISDGQQGNAVQREIFSSIVSWTEQCRQMGTVVWAACSQWDETKRSWEENKPKF